MGDAAPLRLGHLDPREGRDLARRGAQLWEPGSLVPVQWDEEEVDQDLAIKTVVFNQGVGEGESEVGTWADLTLVDPRTLGATSAGKGSGSGAGHGGGEASPDLGAGLEGVELDGGAPSTAGSGLEGVEFEGDGGGHA